MAPPSPFFVDFGDRSFLVNAYIEGKPGLSLFVLESLYAPNNTILGIRLFTAGDAEFQVMKGKGYFTIPEIKPE